MQHTEVIERAFGAVTAGDIECCRTLLRTEYPFTPAAPEKRSYTVGEKMMIFLRDGFIDRYSGDRLVNPGVLKILSAVCPDEFPYHPRWKMSAGHMAYWELFPTVDHLKPIARGGEDRPENRVTTSMLHNMVKGGWTVGQLNWTVHAPGDLRKWDGLTGRFIEFVSQTPGLLEDKYIALWYNAAKKALG